MSQSCRKRSLKVDMRPFLRAWTISLAKFSAVIYRTFFPTADLAMKLPTAWDR